MPKMICICILLIYFKVISKKGGHLAPAYPIVGPIRPSIFIGAHKSGPIPVSD